MSSRWPVTFRIFPEYGSLYFNVIVHRTHAEMIAAGRAEGIRGRYRAFTSTFDIIRVYGEGDARQTRRRPIVGEIHLYRARVGSQIVSHEVTHAACGYFRRLGIPFDAIAEGGEGHACEDEERLAHVIGNMNRQVTIGCIERGIYDGLTLRWNKVKTKGARGKIKRVELGLDYYERAHYAPLPDGGFRVSGIRRRIATEREARALVQRQVSEALRLALARIEGRV
jgi:hypothetical protein